MVGTQIQLAFVAFIVAVAVANGLSRTAGRQGGETATRSAQLRPVAAPAPARAVLPVRRDEYRIAPDPMGQFATHAEVNGARISMLVDTGATLVALSYEDASAAGVFPAPADFKFPVNTANGVAHVARVRLHDVRLGNLVIYDVDAVVGERGALSGSLLGMTFLSRLSHFAMESGALVLKH